MTVWCGDWQLEVNQGTVQGQILFGIEAQENFRGLLADYSALNAVDSDGVNNIVLHFDDAKY